MDKYYPNISGKVYAESNLDRFGQSVMPRKPRNQVPGPGHYSIRGNLEGGEGLLSRIKGGIMLEGEVR